MPQLAPMSWGFLSVFLFFVLFCALSGVWWMKKSPLILVDGENSGPGEEIWLW